MKQVRICHHNTQGLHNDALIIQNTLKNVHVTETVYEELQCALDTPLQNMKHVDVNIFLEHVYLAYAKHANKNILIPNIEWLNKKDISAINCIDAIFCKTQDSYEVMKQHYGPKVYYIGFTSIDRKLNTIVEKSYDHILHVKGISKYKNSQVLVDTWLKHPEWPKLVIIHYGIPHSNGVLHFNKPFQVGPNIIVYQYKLDDASVSKLMNQIGVHICPSFSEGYGHYINEACSTGAFVITTDGYPMKSFVSNENILVKPSNVVNVNLGKGYVINAEDITHAINKLVKFNYSQLKEIGEANRQKYIKNGTKFTKTFNNLIKMFL